MLSPRDSLEIQRLKELKGKGWKNIFYVNTKQDSMNGYINIKKKNRP